MNLARSILRSTGGKVLLVVILGLIVFNTWTALAAPRKIDPRVAESAANGTVDIAVRLNFPPERFHILELQEYGRLAGASGNEVLLRRVPQEQVFEIARLYWVNRIEPFSR